SGFLRPVGKGARGSQANQGELFDAPRNFGSMPCSQGEMEECTATDVGDSPNRLQRRRGEYSSPAALAVDDSPQANQYSRRGGPAFSYCLRKSMPEQRPIREVRAFPFTRPGPAHSA